MIEEGGEVTHWLGRILVGMVALATASATAAAVEPLPPPSCAAQIAATERRHDIPPKLLTAISLVESGRWDDGGGALVAWPWTINAGGVGHFFATKAEAVAEVRRLKAAGVKNIDVGCMQVSLMYHPDAFASLDEAFEPDSNVAYAGRFLRGLFDATGDWPTAAAYYHSQSPGPAAEYRQLLARFWPGDGGAPLLTRAVAQRLDTGAIRYRRTARSPVAEISAVAPSPWLLPRPPSSPAVEEMRQAWRLQADATREQSQRIADAYRQARLAEREGR